MLFDRMSSYCQYTGFRIDPFDDEAAECSVLTASLEQIDVDWLIICSQGYPHMGPHMFYTGSRLSEHDLVGQDMDVNDLIRVATYGVVPQSFDTIIKKYRR